MLFDRNVEVTSAAKFFLELHNGRTLLLDAHTHGVGDVFRSLVIIAFFRLSDMQTVQNSLGLLGVLRFLRQSVVQQNVARLGLNILNALFGDVGHLNQVSVRLLGKCLDHRLFFGVELLKLLDIDLGQADHEWLGLEERLDRVEQLNLLGDCVATRFGDIQHEENRGV